MTARGRGARKRSRYWAAWQVIILGTGLLAGGFVALRNAQVRAGHQMKAIEDRIAKVELEIELYETRIARSLSRAELSTRLRERKPDLRRLGMGEVIRLGPSAAVSGTEDGND